MLNIAVVYTDKIPYYDEHLQSMGNSDIMQHNADSFLVLGQDYNENVADFIKRSIYRNTFTKVVLFDDKPIYKSTYNETDERSKQLSQYYKTKSVELIRNTNTHYGIVIYTQTNVLNIPKLNWYVLYEEILTSQSLYTNPDRTFICGSMSNMMNYLQNPTSMQFKEQVIVLNTIMKTPDIEKYNVLFGFRGFEETCDSERYTKHLEDGSKNYSFENLAAYDTVYFSNLTLRKVYKQLPKIIKKPFILVTGEGDCECPNELFETNDDFIEFIKWDKLTHWYCQNCLVQHPKITLIPLGLDYHTMMYYSHIRGDRGPKMTPIEQESHIMELRKTMKPFWERIPACYGNFQFLTKTKYGGDRIDAINKIPSSAIYYDCKHQRKQTFINQTAFAFVISPFGQDYECIRTWEAFCLGCIPIMKSSPLDSLYQGLPVVIVKDWKEVTPEFLQKTLFEYKEKHLKNEFRYEKLHKYYWVKMLQNKKEELMLQDERQTIEIQPEKKTTCMIKYYLIHCKQHTERDDHIKNIIKRINRPVEIFDGIYTAAADMSEQVDILQSYDKNISFDVDAINHYNIYDYSIVVSKKHFQFKFPGQIGCYLSHHLIIQKVMDDKLNNKDIHDYTVIFEDDLQFRNGIDLDAEIKNVISELNTANKVFDIVFLGSLNYNHGQQITANIYGLDKMKGCFGTHAILINNANIEKIYQSNCNIIHNIDNQYYFNIINNKLNGFVVYPSICFQASNLTSNIDTGTKVYM